MIRWTTWFLLFVLSTVPSLEAQSVSSLRNRKSAFDNVLGLVKEVRQPEPLALDLDVAAMIWAPTALLPVPFLRLIRFPGGDLSADVFVWWLHPADVDSSRLPQNRRCSKPGQGTAVCVARVDVTEQPDWSQLLVEIVGSRVCDFVLSSGPLTVTADAGDLDVRVYRRGRQFEEYSCNAPRGNARPGAREAAHVMDVLEQLVTNVARRRQ